ncbi:DUF4382 domain-containing protein [Chitinophaga horti]|uniref:DUF4382 domain-containing protein n=1 Tax=Chitinophaga horti TaxID=2920382 RepID=A0ABY6J521_9BACT|nr:DUF4382 domain-containing protein [Chitinophaga horti]UYQ94775.1 DUF4382 domain-containing protein [Chitinophaga horti]
MKNLARRIVASVLGVAALSTIIWSCSKDDSASSERIGANQQRLQVYLTDDPGLFDQVFIDIRNVEVLVDTCSSDDDDDRWDKHSRCWWDDGRWDRKKDTCKVWDTLAIRSGIYDILSFRNGVDTLFANGVVPKGTVKKIRITIGNNNSLVKDSVTYPLKTVTGETKLIVNIRGDEWEEYSPDQLRLWLDFDVSRSIVEVRRGTFVLKPYILVWTPKVTGSLSGKVTPADAFPVITVWNTADTLYALPTKRGDFKIRGLKEGSYSLFVNAGNGYRDTTLTGIEIKRNKETKVPSITLRK